MPTIVRPASLASIAEPRPACVVSVAIPASDEAEFIEATLAAFAGQRDATGRPLDPDRFELVVFANRCRDQTAERARAFGRAHAALALHVLQDEGDDWNAHVGYARGAVMDVSCERMLARGAHGIVATTDADTIVSPTWIARTIGHLEHVDAIGGRIVPTSSADGIVRAALRLEHAYKFAIVRLESLLDPDPSDPWPRHGNHQGASLAIRGPAYRRAGGVPRLAILEDFELYKALLRDGSSFRHPLDVRVTTSTRRAGRVAGGFATDLDRLDAHVRGETPFLVTDPAEMVRLYGMRGLVRGAYAARGSSRAADACRNAARAAELDPRALRAAIETGTTLGSCWERLGLMTPSRGEARRLVPIDRALDELATAIAAAGG